MLNARSKRARKAAASLVLTGALAAAGSTAFAAGGGTSVGDGGGGGGGSVSGSGNGVFPVRAKHSYGDGLGAGRGHQGQDIFARCGKPIVAAKRGRVKVVDYEGGGAGNMVVIAGRRKAKDTVYMHMKAPSKLREGKRVQPGELVGRVGETGRATGCHLHFEMWSNPGWYRGGSPVDPKPSLKRWDRNS